MKNITQDQTQSLKKHKKKSNFTSSVDCVMRSRIVNRGRGWIDNKQLSQWVSLVMVEKKRKFYYSMRPNMQH